MRIYWWIIEAKDKYFSDNSVWIMDNGSWIVTFKKFPSNPICLNLIFKKNVFGSLTWKYCTIIVISRIINKFRTVKCKACIIFYTNHNTTWFTFFATTKCNYKKRYKNKSCHKLFIDWHSQKIKRCMLPKIVFTLRYMS